MKADTPSLIKFKHLKRLLGRPDYVVVGLLETLWLATAKNAFLGDIGRHSDEEIASIIEWDGDASELIASLVEAKWLDRVDGPSRLVIHHWYDNAAQYITQKINRHLGYQPEQMKTAEGRAAAKLAWEKTVGVHKQTDHSTPEYISMHMQNGPEYPPHACANLSNPSQAQINKSIDRLDGQICIYDEKEIGDAEWQVLLPDLTLAKDAMSPSAAIAPRNRDTLIRGVHVARQGLTAGYLPDLFDAIRKGIRNETIKRPFGYFKKSLINECTNKGIDFHRAAAAVLIPDKYLNPQRPPP